MFIHKTQHISAMASEFTYDDPNILPNNRWSIYVNFYLIGENKKKVHPLQFYQLIASNEFVSQPTEEYTDYIDSKTVVMNYLDKEKVESDIRLTIEAINNMRLTSGEEYYEQVKKFYSIDD